MVWDICFATKNSNVTLLGILASWVWLFLQRKKKNTTSLVVTGIFPSFLKLE